MKRPQTRTREGRNGGKLTIIEKGERRGGRTPGVPNKITRTLHEACPFALR